jgi:hypothetical protein
MKGKCTPGHEKAEIDNIYRVDDFPMTVEEVRL